MRHETFATIVVGVDGRTGGADAATLAGQLAGPSTTVALVHVVPEDRAHEPGRTLLRAARVAFDRPCLTLLRTADDIGTGLQQAARDLGADAIVIGSPRATPGRRNPARSAGHPAPGAVCVWPSHRARRGRTRTRDAAHRRRVPRHAIRPGRTRARSRARRRAPRRTARDHGRPLLPSPWLGPTLGGAEAAGRLSGEATEQARAHLEGLPGVQGTVAEGDPAAQLTRFSRTVDLLIVGTRGHGALRRLLVGSTAEVLLTASACRYSWSLVVPWGRRPRTPAGTPSQFGSRRADGSRAPGGMRATRQPVSRHDRGDGRAGTDHAPPRPPR